MYDALRHFWPLRLIVRAIMFGVTAFFFGGMIWTPWKWAITLSELGSSIPGSWQYLWHFSRNLGEIKNRIKWEVIGAMSKNKGNRNNWCVFLIVIRIWIQRKGWLGSWHMSCCRRVKSIFRSCLNVGPRALCTLEKCKNTSPPCRSMDSENRGIISDTNFPQDARNRDKRRNTRSPPPPELIYGIRRSPNAKACEFSTLYS